MTTTRTITIERRNYSRNPWRLIDSATGAEVITERRQLDHPHLGTTSIAVPGYPTRTAATHALGTLAARALTEQEHTDDTR